MKCIEFELGNCKFVGSFDFSVNDDLLSYNLLIDALISHAIDFNTYEV